MAKKALVVDNDFFFVEFLSGLLEKKGYEVVKAFDGEEGLLKLDESVFDILFVDLIMPKIDGTQVIRFARRKFSDRRLAVILISSTLIEQMDEVSGIGADYCVVKGPLSQMTDILNGLLDNLETDGLPESAQGQFVGSDNLYPRQATSELLEARKFQKAIIDSIGIGILVTGRDTRVVSANPMALELLNRPFEDVMNLRITTLFPKEESRRLVDAFKAVAANLDLRKRRIYVTFGFDEIKLDVSVFRMGNDPDGWVLAMERV